MLKLNNSTKKVVLGLSTLSILGASQPAKAENYPFDSVPFYACISMALVFGYPFKELESNTTLTRFSKATAQAGCATVSMYFLYLALEIIARHYEANAH